MEVDDLVFPLVPDEDYEGTVILLDIIVDESRNTLVKLLPHAEGVARDEKVKKSYDRLDNRYDNHVVI
jgi:hypothetical protein